jgi:hypothetical protein
MSAQMQVDQEYVEEQIELSWNSWNPKQKTLWLVMHGLKLLPLGTSWEFKNIPYAVQDALYCEFVDNAKKDFDYDRENTLRQDF